jgi:hypothetical protein
MWLLSLLGCHHEESTALPEKPPVDAPVPFQPTAEESAMITRLSNKDGAPSCTEVEALAAAPTPALQRIVEGVSRPPTVAMRAADCLIIGHSAEITPVLEAWVVDPSRRGLALLVLDRLDKLPPDVALILAKDAMGGPLQDLAVPRISRSTNPDVKALAGGAP